MNTELRNYWYAICLMPHMVKTDDPEIRNKFVACLVGDELADDKEFEAMAKAVTTCTYDSCHWRYNGACFHPFRPGSVIDAIFTSVFRGDPNARPLVKEDAEDHLDNRKCAGCAMGATKWMLHESAFNGLGHVYDRMMENVAKHGTLYGYTWEKFWSQHSYAIDNVPFFEHGKFKDYEGNVRAHFKRLLERHYKILEKAVSWQVPWDKRNEREDAIAKALGTVRFELVMHFANYWEKELYKKEDA